MSSVSDPPSADISPLPPSLQHTNTSDESSASHSTPGNNQNNSIMNTPPPSSSSSLSLSSSLPPLPLSIPTPSSSSSAALYDRTHSVSLNIKPSSASFQLMNNLRATAASRLNEFPLTSPFHKPHPPSSQSSSSSSSSSNPSSSNSSNTSRPLPLSLTQLAAMQSEEMNDSDGGLSLSSFHKLDTLHNAISASAVAITNNNNIGQSNPFSAFPSSSPQSIIKNESIQNGANVGVIESVSIEEKKKRIHFATDVENHDEENNRGGGEEGGVGTNENNHSNNNNNNANNREIDDEQVLPSANIARIMKLALPDGAKMSKEARSAVQDCVSEFIGFITSESSELLMEEQRKTITGDDLVDALKAMGFHHYIKFLTLYLHRFRQSPKSLRKSIKRNKKLHMTGDIAAPILQQAVLSRINEKQKMDKKKNHKRSSASIVSKKKSSDRNEKKPKINDDDEEINDNNNNDINNDDDDQHEDNSSDDGSDDA